jgi:hypothetical protein
VVPRRAHVGLDEAATCAREAFHIAGAAEHLYTQAQSQVAAGILALQQLDVMRAFAALEQARTLCQEGNLPLTPAMTEVHLGRAYAVGGRVADAVAVLTGRAPTARPCGSASAISWP